MWSAGCTWSKIQMSMVYIKLHIRCSSAQLLRRNWELYRWQNYWSLWQWCRKWKKRTRAQGTWVAPEQNMDCSNSVSFHFHLPLIFCSFSKQLEGFPGPGSTITGGWVGLLVGSVRISLLTIFWFFAVPQPPAWLYLLFVHRWCHFGGANFWVSH